MAEENAVANVVNAQQVKDLVFDNSQKIGEFRLLMKQDLKRARFAAEKRTIKMTEGDELKDMIAKANFEEKALQVQYEASLAALKERQAKELEGVTDPIELEELKLAQQAELNKFIGRDDKVVKIQNKAQMLDLKERQTKESEEFAARKASALEGLSEEDAKVKSAELKEEEKALKKNHKHEEALLVMKQRQLYSSTGYYVSKQRNHKSSQKRNRIIANTSIYVVLTIISVIWLLPFVFILLQSLRTETYHGVSGYLLLIDREYDAAGNVISRHWNVGWDNYAALFKTSENNFLKWYLNTFIIAVCTAAGQTIMVLLVSYGLSRLRFRGRKMLMNIMLVLGMFPGFLTMIILYWMLSDMGLTQGGAVGGIILVNIASSGMGYYVCKGYFDTIPKSLDEAARIDGATRAGVFFKVIIPMSGPIIIYVILTAFMGPWADYIFASYIAFGEESSYNVAVGLYTWLTKDQINSMYTEFCAGGVLVAIPVTVLFMCLQKFYVEGVTGGAVKG